MRILSNEVVIEGTREELYQLQGQMFDEGNKIFAMLVRMRADAGVMNVTFADGEIKLRALVARAGLEIE